MSQVGHKIKPNRLPDQDFVTNETKYLKKNHSKSLYTHSSIDTETDDSLKHIIKTEGKIFVIFFA